MAPALVDNGIAARVRINSRLQAVSRSPLAGSLVRVRAEISGSTRPQARSHRRSRAVALVGQAVEEEWAISSR
jgi:hypothetical protein